MNLPIDLRSDTVTLPTEAMRDAMRDAPLGDDVFGEDPTINRLQELAAEMTGKEAALLVSSGTQGNLVSLMSHCQHGDEVIMEAQSHTYWSEQGGMASLAGLLPRLVESERGCPTAETIQAAIRSDDQHNPRSGLVCLENTHNRHGGTVSRPQQMAAIKRVAEAHGLPVHLDGARLFNAAVALGVEARELTEHVDSVTFCLSKGLSCPVGSIVCGSRDFIGRAHRARKVLGGGMRQAGVIAAAGIVALGSMIDRLAEDHANARRLALGLHELPGVTIDLDRVETNMVYVDFGGSSVTADALEADLRERGVLTRPSYDRVRLVLHYGIEAADVDFVIDSIADALRPHHGAQVMTRA
ncbi:MAG TPA: low-specificity L-threonine aldolase [Chloroflexota bacterium]|jgi:threonine aldolase|nr:low-specificity L-threonine aldolase [Chloroflexota bacterium]